LKGPELRRIRRRLNLTQAAFGKILGVTANTVSRWERNVHPVDEPAARLATRLLQERIEEERSGRVG
jgi:DNA-binding transcriptional regulator YiaG